MLALTSVSGAKSRLRWLRFGHGSKRCITRQGGTGAAGVRPCVIAKRRLSVPWLRGAAELALSLR